MMRLLGVLPLMPLWDEDVSWSHPTVPRDKMHWLFAGGKSRHLGCIIYGVAQVVVTGDTLSTKRAVETVDAHDIHLGAARPRGAGPCLSVDRDPQSSPNGVDELLLVEVETEGFAGDSSQPITCPFPTQTKETSFVDGVGGVVEEVSMNGLV